MSRSSKKPSDEGHEAKRFVPSANFASTLAHGLKTLSALRAEGAGVSNAELAQHVGLSRPAISRLCSLL